MIQNCHLFIQEKFNLKINIICPNVAGTGDQLYNTRTAAGNLGDLIVQLKSRMIDCYNVGLLASMSPYLDDCPNLLKLETAYEAFRVAMGADEVYAIPGWVSNNADDQPSGRGVNLDKGTNVRWDAYVAEGMPEINSHEELLDLLMKMQDDFPTNKNGDKCYALSLFPDWDGSDEGNLLFNSQVEGVTYEMVDGHPVLTEFGLDTNPDKAAPDSMGGGNWSDGGQKINYPLIHSDDPNALLNGEPVTTTLWKSVLDNERNDYSNQWEGTYGFYAPLDYLKSKNQLGVVVGTTYTVPADSTDIASIRGQLSTLTAAAGWKMIYASSDEEFQQIWDDMKTEIVDFGFDELVEWDTQITQDWCDSVKAVLGN